MALLAMLQLVREYLTQESRVRLCAGGCGRERANIAGHERKAAAAGRVYGMKGARGWRF
jgi:hypothetical protein